MAAHWKEEKQSQSLAVANWYRKKKRGVLCGRVVKLK
jgi:hypothetical protein